MLNKTSAVKKTMMKKLTIYNIVMKRRNIMNTRKNTKRRKKRRKIMKLRTWSS